MFFRIFLYLVDFNIFISPTEDTPKLNQNPQAQYTDTISNK